MNERETKLRDLLAYRTGVSPEDFEVAILIEGQDLRIEVRLLRDLDPESVHKLQTAIKPRRWYSGLLRPHHMFILCLGLFAADALVFRSWSCLLVLLLAWLTMPQKCPDCDRYHRFPV